MNRWEKIKYGVDILTCLAVIAGVIVADNTLKDTRKLESVS